jgi:cellulose synthase/poly-beta-1,6-N-acetylglucosamine synthase-like glycosyltransferase
MQAGRVLVRHSFAAVQAFFPSILEGAALERSLTVLLPVQDAQATLADTVTEVLEMAADLSDRIELVIIDDGSTDATSEVADELSRRYPQVRSIRHGKPLGRDAALRAGMAKSRGEVVFVRDEEHHALALLPRPSKRTSSKPARPNYLGRKRQFALEP